ncbi:MAG: hypothetical protein K0S07_1244 [Chlamydiales bacterium]|jgi:TrmH family RNA methyltransferase|nr:hypothetical protein [Chlamydiales bacterium]
MAQKKWKNKPMTLIPLSKETNEIQRAIVLRASRNKRHRYREFLIEGHAAIDQAYEMGWTVKTLFVNQDAPRSAWATRLLANKKYEVAYSIPSSLMEKIAEQGDLPELLAIGETRPASFLTYQPKPRDVVILLDEPKSPGNLGMIIRSAVAFGASAIVISGRGADAYDPKCIRSSVGTFFSIPIYHVDGVKQFAAHLQALRMQHDIALIASGDRGDTSLYEASFGSDLLFLILGNETSGVSVSYQQLADQFVQIPLPGKFTSLNVGAAASIFFYEIFRQRQ